jgi:hypothetical protein
MGAANAVPRSAKVISWIARIWSILIFIDALIITFRSDPFATEAAAITDAFLLSLYGVAILGLLIAWRWKLMGGIITIVTMFVRELAWIILKGQWVVSFLIIWLFLAPPAILFLVAWALERRAKKASPQTSMN